MLRAKMRIFLKLSTDRHKTMHTDGKF